MRFASGLPSITCRFFVIDVNFLTRSFSFSIGLQLEILAYLLFYDHTDERKDVWPVSRRNR